MKLRSKIISVYSLISLLGICAYADNPTGPSDIILGGPNAWMLRTSDESRSSLTIVPYANDQWKWDAQSAFMGAGGLSLNGTLIISKPREDGQLLEIHNKQGVWGINVASYFDETILDLRNGTNWDPVIRLRSGNEPSFFNAGNLGIGTTTPQHLLHVKSSAATVAKFESNTNNSQIVLATAMGSVSITAADAGNLYIGDGSTGGIIFRNFGNTSRLVILGDGRIGVGTVSPSHHFTVNGTIRSKEIIVDNSGWADDVFYPNYTLRSLSETENYIKTEGRLPDVPNAKQVAEQGVSVGEIQAILLRKIEELTLHMIAQGKEIETLKKQNADLQNKLGDR